MSHASATVTLSAHITEAVPARPLLVVERLDRTFGSTALFCLCASPIPANFASATAPVTAECDAVAAAWI
ncbi:hypothetical protein [Streptomyces mirabilis]|uniref:hypothetical protein n=1 Tax=Streptomyces mirabilis TaxID=68239 RepID=UPI0033B18F0C